MKHVWWVLAWSLKYSIAGTTDITSIPGINWAVAPLVLVVSADCVTLQPPGWNNLFVCFLWTHSFTHQFAFCKFTLFYPSCTCPTFWVSINKILLLGWAIDHFLYQVHCCRYTKLCWPSTTPIQEKVASKLFAARDKQNHLTKVSHSYGAVVWNQTMLHWCSLMACHLISRFNAWGVPILFVLFILFLTFTSYYVYGNKMSPFSCPLPISVRTHLIR